MSEEKNTDIQDVQLTEETRLNEPDARIVFDTLNAYLDGRNVRVNIDGRSADVINRIMASFPNIITDMDNHVQKIISDKVIDMNDLPHLILMIKDVININAKDLKSIKVNRSEAVNFIKDVIFILIDTNVIKTNDNKDTILALLNLSVQMLDASIELNETIDCNKWCCC